MKRFLLGLVVALAFSGFAQADPPYSNNSGIRAYNSTLDATKITCVDEITGVSESCAGSGGGGGTTAVTATAAAPTYIEGSASNPISSTLKGGIRFMPITPAGVNIDLSLPSSIMGLDGSTIMGTTNPIAAQLTQGSAKVGQVAVDHTTPGTSDAVVVSSSALPTGAATEASLAKLTLGQASATSGQSGPLTQGAVTSAVPVYTNGQTSPLSLDTQGLLRVGGLAQGSTTNGQSGILTQCAVTTAAPSYTTAQTNPLSCDTTGTLRVTGGGVGQGSTTSGQSGNLEQGAVTTGFPTYVTGQTSPLSLTTTGALRVELGVAGAVTPGAATNSDSLTVTSGAAAIYTNSITRLYDGTDFDRARNISGSFGSAVGVTAVEQAGSSFQYISTATTTQVKSGAGILHKISVNTCVASATIDLIDNTAGTTINIGRITCPSTVGNPFTMVYDISFATGLRIVTSGATDITVDYR